MRPLLIRYGNEVPGRVLSYVWASSDQRESNRSPFGGAQHKMIVKRNNRSRLGAWLEEKVDIVADYKDVFCGEPKSVSHILISSDTDDTPFIHYWFCEKYPVYRIEESCLTCFLLTFLFLIQSDSTSKMPNVRSRYASGTSRPVSVNAFVQPRHFCQPLQVCFRA